MTTDSASVSASARPAPRPLGAGAIFLRLLLLAAVATLLFVGFLAWTFLPRGEVRALRAIALSELPGRWERIVEVRVGGALLGAGQITAALAHAPAEARAVLACVDSAEVSVHQRTGGPQHGDIGRLLERCRAAMAERGWEPLVAVHDHGDTVAVFTDGEPSGGVLKLCVLVQAEENLVVVACRGRPGPLMKLLEQKTALLRERAI